MVAINAAWETSAIRSGGRATTGRRAAAPRVRRPSAAVPTRAVRPAQAPLRGADRRADRRGGDRPHADRRQPASSSDGGRLPDPPSRPENVSRDWTPGRSTRGSGYDAKTMRAPEGLGQPGRHPGTRRAGVVTFGRYAGWSIGEIGRVDLEYVEWLDRMPIGRPYRDEIDVILRRAGRRRSAAADATNSEGYSGDAEPSPRLVDGLRPRGR